MKLKIRVILLYALVFIAHPLCAAEYDLEKRVIDLEKRVSDLENANKITPLKPLDTSVRGNWKDIKNWRQLQQGMSYDAVRSLLGEPDNIDGGSMTHWYWGNRDATVVFFLNRLNQWTEPR